MTDTHLRITTAATSWRSHAPGSTAHPCAGGPAQRRGPTGRRTRGGGAGWRPHELTGAARRGRGSHGRCPPWRAAAGLPRRLRGTGDGPPCSDGEEEGQDARWWVAWGKGQERNERGSRRSERSVVRETAYAGAWIGKRRCGERSVALQPSPSRRRQSPVQCDHRVHVLDSRVRPPRVPSRKDHRRVRLLPGLARRRGRAVALPQVPAAVAPA